eukprot:9019190-Prorocentrum_lima.AAC.1
MDAPQGKLVEGNTGPRIRLLDPRSQGSPVVSDRTLGPTTATEERNTQVDPMPNPMAPAEQKFPFLLTIPEHEQSAW